MPKSPIYDNQFHLTLKTGKYPEQDAYYESKKYANLHAFRNALIQEILKRIQNPERRLIEEILGIEDDACRRGVFVGQENQFVQREILKILNIDSEYHLGQFIQRIIHEMHGVVISLCPQILELQHRPGVGDDVVIIDPAGVSLDMINGIEPQGQFEWNEMMNNKMQNVVTGY